MTEWMAWHERLVDVTLSIANDGDAIASRAIVVKIVFIPVSPAHSAVFSILRRWIAFPARSSDPIPAFELKWQSRSGRWLDSSQKLGIVRLKIRCGVLS
jgi:hypothetical protein